MELVVEASPVGSDMRLPRLRLVMTEEGNDQKGKYMYSSYE